MSTAGCGPYVPFSVGDQNILINLRHSCYYITSLSTVRFLLFASDTFQYSGSTPGSVIKDIPDSAQGAIYGTNNWAHQLPKMYQSYVL